jgi:hypothetical protein
MMPRALDRKINDTNEIANLSKFLAILSKLDKKK